MMGNTYKKLRGHTKQSIHFKVILILAICILSLSLGYAALNSTIKIEGSAKAVIFGKIFIEEVKLQGSANASNATLPEYSDTTLNSSINFENSQTAYITYKVKITNATGSIQKYAGETFDVLSATSNIINYKLEDGININEYLLPGESTTFTLTYEYRVAPTVGTYNLKMIFNFGDIGKIFATNNTNLADLRSTDLAPLSLKITNKYNTSVNYNLKLSNEKFVLTDANGNLLSGLTIDANTVQDITVYVKEKDGEEYYGENYTSDLILVHDGTEVNFSTFDIQTNKTPGVTDTTPPQIGPVLININPDNPEVGTFDVNWTRTDTDGSPVVKYFVKLYTSDGNLIKTVETNGDITTYHFTSMAPNTYYALVYGEDEAGNSGESACSTATTTTTDCRRSDNTEIRWRRTVTYNLTNVDHEGPDFVNLGEQLVVTATVKAGMRYTKRPTVTSDGKALTENKDYTIDEDSGVLTIPKVTGDIVISATASNTVCLVEGTKMLMADGTCKLVEDIKYDDLLLVYSHEIGEFVPEYPIWIEQKDVCNSYQLTTFSDGTNLKTVDKHAVFSSDDNKYVDVNDNDAFKVGMKVKKVRKENNKYEFYDVIVTDIQIINEQINSYDVVSTRYYNAITDDVLTSDGRVILSNAYGFKENLLWSDMREEAIKNEIFIDYKDFSFVPYYLFHGLRAKEGAVLTYYNLMDADSFISVFKNLLLNDEMLLPPMTDKDNDRIWMVTTSDDIVNENNKKDYLHKENSKYLLREPINKHNFVKWYCTSDGNYYNPGDEITVYHGTHFMAIYQ